MASSSPRRRDLLRGLGLRFVVMKPPEGAEPLCSGAMGPKDWWEAWKMEASADLRAASNCEPKELGEVELREGEGQVVYEVAGKGSNLCLRLYDPSEALTLAEVVREVQDSAAAKALGVAKETALLTGSQEIEGELAVVGGESSRLNSGRCLIVGADTVVVSGKDVLGKPRSQQEAEAMLSHLSGRWHHVVTGVAVQEYPTNRVVRACAVTAVKFRSLPQKDIAAYVNTGHPLDKAGAYGIQELGALLVEKIDGCYFNVVGLPLTVLKSLCLDLGEDLWELRMFSRAGLD